MKRMSYVATVILFVCSVLGAQDAVMSFENLTTSQNCTNVTCNYVDPDDPAIPHDLMDVGGLPVSSPSSSTVLGFVARFIPSRSGSSGASGLTDGDFFGYAGSTTIQNELGTPPTDGTQAYIFEDTDGMMRLTFQRVTLGAGALFSMDYHIESTDYEISDGANDRFYVEIAITDCAAANTIVVIDTDGGGSGGGGGGDIDDLAIEDAWNTLSANLSAYQGCSARLMIEGDSNSASEEMAIDNIRITSSAVLPVEWYSFEAKVAANGAELVWQTVSESGNRGFSVQRSTDGRNFATIGWVDGKVSTTTRQMYSFHDETPHTGSNFYRLQQEDFDGTTDFSQLIRLEFLVAQPAPIRIAPNPFSDQFTVFISEDMDDGVVRLLDINGCEVSSVMVQAGQQQVRLGNSLLPAGVYFLRIGNETKRVVKQ